MVCGRPLDVQKAQTKDAMQRSGGGPRGMRSRPGPPTMSRPNYNSGYDNYQQNNYNDPFGQMPNNNNYNGYNSNFQGHNGNDAPFGQGFVRKAENVLDQQAYVSFRYGQESFGGPMRRGNMGGHGYAPYNNRGRGGPAGVSGGDVGGQGPSWASWN